MGVGLELRAEPGQSFPLRASLDPPEKVSGGSCSRTAGRRAWWPRAEVSAAGTDGRTGGAAGEMGKE